MITIPTFNIKEIRKRFEYLKNCIHFEDKKNQENELNMRMHDPTFWNDAKMAETISKDWKNLSKLIHDINLTDDNITYLELLSNEWFVCFETPVFFILRKHYGNFCANYHN